MILTKFVGWVSEDEYMEVQRKNKPFKEGMKAFREGKDLIEDNPYPLRPDDRFQWGSGWKAEKEYLEA